MDSGHTPVGILPVCSSGEEEEEVNGEEEGMSVYGSSSSFTSPLKSDVRVALDSVRRKRRMRVLQKFMKVVLRPLREWALEVFVIMTQGRGAEWMCGLLLGTYCSNIPKSVDISWVRSAVAAERIWVWCMVTSEDIISRRVSGERLLKNTTKVGDWVSETQRSKKWNARSDNERYTKEGRDSGQKLMEAYSLSA